MFPSSHHHHPPATTGQTRSPSQSYTAFRHHHENDYEQTVPVKVERPTMASYHDVRPSIPVQHAFTTSQSTPTIQAATQWAMKPFPSPTFTRSQAQVNDYSAMTNPFINQLSVHQNPNTHMSHSPVMVSRSEPLHSPHSVSSSTSSHPFPSPYLHPSMGSAYWTEQQESAQIRINNESRDAWAVYPSLVPQQPLEFYSPVTTQAPQTPSLPADTPPAPPSKKRKVQKSSPKRKEKPRERTTDYPHSPQDTTSEPPERTSRKTRTKTTRENAKYDCHICGMLTRRKYNLRVHMDTHNPNREYGFPCERDGCNSKFSRRADLTRHEKAVRHFKVAETHQQ